jgi:hypothetical protein
LQDFICGGCSDKGFRSIVVVSHVAVDGDIQIEATLEDTSADALSGDLTEEALDEIEPGGRSSVRWAVVVFITRMIVTFTADHFVRPVLIGGATKLPFFWVLLGILGGVEV